MGWNKYSLAMGFLLSSSGGEDRGEEGIKFFPCDAKPSLWRAGSLTVFNARKK